MVSKDSNSLTAREYEILSLVLKCVKGKLDVRTSLRGGMRYSRAATIHANTMNRPNRLREARSSRWLW